MTVDGAGRCVGLGSWVGLAIRQIVDARVLLTATVPPALPGRSMSDAALAPPFLDVITHFLRSAWRDCHLSSNCPNETRQLASDRGGDDIGRLAGAGEPAIARAQPDLTLPGDVTDRVWPGLPALPAPAGQPGPETGAPH